MADDQDDEGGDAPGGCADSWTAAKPVRPAKPIFDETGWFPLICRHGPLFAYCDMKRTNECSKFPLALIDWLSKVYRKGKIVVGYDIGCSFATTLKNEKAIDKETKERVEMSESEKGTIFLSHCH